METQKWLVFFSTFIILFNGNIESANATVMFVFGDYYVDTGNHNKSMASWLPPYGITYPGKPSGRYSNGRLLTDFVGNIESANASVMFVFGDSYADTGNHNKSMPSWLPPYGITYPGKPSGRYSNGRLLTDFVASYFNVNSPVPYEHRNDSDRNITADGINFAYGGTGVFNTSNGLPNLTAQIDLLEQLVQGGVYSVQDLESSLVLVSVAGNDYIFYLQNHSFEGVDLFVPKLIKQLSVDLELLYKMGIRKVAVNAMEPFGCLPYFTIEYSYKYCNETANKMALYHNQLLQEAVAGINKNLSGVNMVILDLYSAIMATLSDPPFVLPANLEKSICDFAEPILKPCCSGNSTTDHCGSVDSEGDALYNLCTDPSSAFFWDPLHLTQEAWHTLMPSFASSLNSLMSSVQNRSSIWRVEYCVKYMIK